MNWLMEKLGWDPYDYKEAWKYAKEFTAEDVDEVIASREGENDEKAWSFVGRLRDGRFGWFSSWCDYTGWG